MFLLHICKMYSSGVQTVGGSPLGGIDDLLVGREGRDGICKMDFAWIFHVGKKQENYGMNTGCWAVNRGACTQPCRHLWYQVLKMQNLL